MESDCLRINGLVRESIVDGPGLRYTVFVQGCPHFCPGCHNPSSHSFDGGSLLDIKQIISDIRANPLLAGLTLSGGEPFCQAALCAKAAASVHELGKNVVTYSGYTLEQLQEMAKADAGVAALLQETDTLIDGLYLQELRDLTLTFRGSSNQRIIDLAALRKTAKDAT